MVITKKRDCHAHAQTLSYPLVTVVFTIPANTKRNKHVIITSKRRFDVIIRCLLRCVLAGILRAEPLLVTEIT